MNSVQAQKNINNQLWGFARQLIVNKQIAAAFGSGNLFIKFVHLLPHKERSPSSNQLER